MAFLSYLNYSFNLVEIPTILNDNFLCPSTTPKRALTKCQWLFLGQTHVFTRAKEQYWHVDRLPVDIRASSESLWDKRGWLGHSTHWKFQIFSEFWAIYHQLFEWATENTEILQYNLSFLAQNCRSKIKFYISFGWAFQREMSYSTFWRSPMAN